MIEIKVYERSQLAFEINDEESTHICIMEEGDKILGMAGFTFSRDEMILNFTEMRLEDPFLFDGLIKTAVNYAYSKGLYEMEIYDEETIDYLNNKKIEMVNNTILINEFYSKNNCHHKKV